MLYSDINLQHEVYREDVFDIAKWLKDEEVSKFLNEKDGITNSLDNLAKNSTLPVMTQYFNNNGPFYMIEHKNKSIGYLKIVTKGNNNSAEIVVAIGDKKKWGQGIGTIAVKKALSEAFLKYRVKKVVAKIHKENYRSSKVFKKVGFIENELLEKETKYLITFNNYISQFSS
ncbi:GNAT family protein [Clostridium sp. CMCC3677]|uniref:GNAT family N-acetyltransferase n=1 Tax=Clostridium sp. CMCC3677 TaxID=2949963 RepID=UPI0013F0A4E7|nr:GNAT family protein [Clostridium sp. CMCC3677]NFG61153.1 GNAT family N-acetyltransferase [Clostridium botulinum]NFQ08899.1 GNAT family N-acetyltransferase [Clostridium botulinum]